MKRTLFLSVLFGMLLTTAHAENESHQQVESTLYAYYRWCNNNIREYVTKGDKGGEEKELVILTLKGDTISQQA